MEAHLLGNPSTGVPGVVMQVDRLRGAQARQSRLTWLIAVPVVGFIVERFLSLWS